jgi:hypothetical protein
MHPKTKEKNIHDADGQIGELKYGYENAGWKCVVWKCVGITPKNEFE